MSRILLSIGGPESEKAVLVGGNMPSWDTIIGVDSGGTRLFELRMPAHGIIGDLDSISADALAFHEAHGAWVKRFPVGKDFTDLELALQMLPDRPENEIHIAPLFGGRFDHSLMNILALSRYSSKGLYTFDVEGGCGGVMCPGQLKVGVSECSGTALIALSPEVAGIDSGGVKWPLKSGSLKFGESRGISNRLEKSPWLLKVEDGCLCWLISGTLRAGVEIEWHPSGV